MVTILLHSSKTMRRASEAQPAHKMQQPRFLNEANILSTSLKTLSPAQLQTMMQLSAPKAQATHTLIQEWNTLPTLPAIDAFLGDIYSGLQVRTFTEDDREYAHKHLFILSGLYGVLRALDEIQPYRLEMGYKLPEPLQKSLQQAKTLYAFWGDKIAHALPKEQVVINLSAAEYTKAVFPHFKSAEGFKDIQIITPKFFTVSPKTGEPTFVTVHAKVARGAFARWLIQHRIEDPAGLKAFSELGYAYVSSLSTETEPVFVAKEFQGLGLSVRLT